MKDSGIKQSYSHVKKISTEYPLLTHVVYQKEGKKETQVRVSTVVF